jgi:hypothetical protein
MVLFFFRACGIILSMNKLSQKTEENVLIVTAFFVLISSMIDAMISAGIAIVSLIVFFGYNFLTKKS